MQEFLSGSHLYALVALGDTLRRLHLIFIPVDGKYVQKNDHGLFQLKKEGTTPNSVIIWARWYRCLDVHPHASRQLPANSRCRPPSRRPSLRSFVAPAAHHVRHSRCMGEFGFRLDPANDVDYISTLGRPHLQFLLSHHFLSVFSSGVSTVDATSLTPKNSFLVIVSFGSNEGTRKGSSSNQGAGRKNSKTWIANYVPASLCRANSTTTSRCVPHSSAIYILAIVNTSIESSFQHSLEVISIVLV